jgi:hypothetical protein
MNTNMIGHNGNPEVWRDDMSCQDLMSAILRLADVPFAMEALHLGYIQFFGDSYRNSLFAQIVRRKLHEVTGREAA